MLKKHELEENFDTFREFCESLGERSKSALELVDFFKERLALAPAAMSSKHSGAYLGGLISENLKLLENATKIVKTFSLDVSSESLILCCLFRNIGLLGTKEVDLYVDQTNEWRRDNLNEVFACNPNISFMTVTDRTVFLLQQFGIKLEEDEFLAITLSNNDNKRYQWSEPVLAFVIQSVSKLITYLK